MRRANNSKSSFIFILQIVKDKRKKSNFIMTGTNGNGSARVGTSTVKQGLAQMLKGGVIVSRRQRVQNLTDIHQGVFPSSHGRIDGYAETSKYDEI